MNKVTTVLVGVIALLAFLVVVLFVWRTWFSEPPFAAVYLRTGELYFGRLLSFPSFGLKQVYLLQVNQGDTQNPLRVQRFQDVFWGPADYLKINRAEVVWVTELRSDSQLLNLLKTNPTLMSTGAAPGAPQTQTPPAPENQQ